MSSVLIHVGYPKCMSTSLQLSLFDRHPDINFAGVGVGDPISYANKEIEYIFEILLKYSRQDFFKEKIDWAREVLSDFIDQNKLNVFSSEYLIMSISPQEIDPDEKLERLYQLFSGLSPQILMIKRDIDSLIRSFYGELVKLGYTESFEDYLKWLSDFEDRNFFRDLNFENKRFKISKWFDRIHELEFDEVKVGNKSIMECLKGVFPAIKNHPEKITHENPSFTEGEIELIRQHNEHSRRGIGKGIYHPFEFHRNRSLNEIDGKNISQDELFSDVIRKRQVLKNVVDSK